MAEEKIPVWKEVWNELTPVWMFCCRPDDFASSGGWSCPGLFWLPGLLALFTFHVACLAALFMLWFKHGYRNELWVSLTPLVLIWLVFVSADIKFRLQRPTKAQRTGFDNAVLHRFGLVTTVFGFLFTIVSLLFSFFSFVWQQFH